MTLVYAQHYAAKIMEWIAPYSDGAEIAGSIRRESRTCNDVDIVCIPKTKQDEDLLGAVVNRENLLFNFIKAHARSGAARITSGGESQGKQIVVELKKCQLDLWFADEKNFATRLLCRTGSMQHNIWIAERAKRLGKKFASYEGILSGGKWVSALGGEPTYVQSDNYAELTLNQFATEEEIYRFLDLPFIEPQNRELEYLVKNFGQ